MFTDHDMGVVIADGRSGVRLSRTSDHPSFGYPTLIEVRAGPFSGAVTDETVGSYSVFLERLEALYNRLSGTATLSSAEGFSISLDGNGRGGIVGSAVVVSEHVPSVRLTFEFLLDQSYLPKIIEGIRREFPSMPNIQNP